MGAVVIGSSIEKIICRHHRHCRHGGRRHDAVVIIIVHDPLVLLSFIMRRRRRAYVVDGAPCDEASIASARARGATSSDGGFEVEFGDETSSGGAWGASSIGGACEATTRIDSAIAGIEDVDGALALRYTVDANFSAAIEARVVREEGVAYAREVHLGSLRANANANADAVGWIRGLIVAPK